MRKILLLAAFLPVFLEAQIRDDFSDGDFTNNPTWEGDISHFKISYSSAIPASQRPALQLDAPAAGQSYLFTAVYLSGELEWHFWVKLSLNTSSGNFARFYLLADTSDLAGPLQGYFIQTGGIEDSVIFFRQDGENITRLLRMSNAYTGNSTNSLRFRVTRSQEGHWQFYADPEGGSMLEFQGAVTDLVYPNGHYFVIFSQFTSSNVSKFYYDDFYAGPLIVDSLPPLLLKAAAMNPQEVLLLFDEAVDPVIAEDTLNYEVTEGIGHPYAAIRMLDAEQVRLFFDRHLQVGVSYQLNISNMKDLAGNGSGQLSSPLLYYYHRPYDVIITEIMADPSPPSGLPEHEYLELLNRCQFEIDLEGWQLSVSSTTLILPSVMIKPGEYLLLTGLNGVESLQAYGTTIGLSSFTLPNNGATLRLADSGGQMVCVQYYDLSWYKDDAKTAGGWALEITDLENLCLGEEIWMASGHPSGGTPGKENFYQFVLQDGLIIENVCATGETTIEITFNQSVDSLSASELWRYVTNPVSGLPDSVKPVPPEFRCVRLHYSQGFSSGQTYEMTILNGMKNCIGEEMPATGPELFAITEPTAPFDVILNEILFNPVGDGVDYIEIYNRSGNAVNLAELRLATVKETPPNPPDTQFVQLTDHCRTLLAGHYLVLTSDPEMVKYQYYTMNPRAFIKMNPFPSYNNDQGVALLLNLDGLVIDGLHYHEDMHYSLLNSYDGVSLEKICPDRLGDQPDNWHSAAETVGFGTPGYLNSQFLQSWDDKGSSLSLFPEVFSPDSDGIDDQLGISFQFDVPGKLVTVLVFNAAGKLAKTLVTNELTGTSGIYSWDGTLDDRTPGPNGIYVVYMEALGMDGKTHRFKKACVLARRR